MIVIIGYMVERIVLHLFQLLKFLSFGKGNGRFCTSVLVTAVLMTGVSYPSRDLLADSRGRLNRNNPVDESVPAAGNLTAAITKATSAFSDRTDVDLPGVDLRGWDHLYRLLLEAGVAPEKLKEILSSKEMPRSEIVFFNARPQEPSALYRKVNTQKARKNALDFYINHRDYFIDAQKAYQVPRGVILAILQVESNCGKNTGKETVFYRLARLASVTEAVSLQKNIERNTLRHPDLKEHEVTDRAKWLQDTFLPHVQATIELAEANGVGVLELKGSGAGAIGLPQFLPGNIELFGVDGDGDGKIDLFTASDAIPSVAKFLHSHGWQHSRLTNKEQLDILKHYNRSEPYVQTVLQMSQSLEANIANWEKSREKGR